MFSSGIAVAAVCLTYYLAAPNRAEWRGAVAGGLVWGLCMLGRPWIERSMGLWRSRIEGIEDPLQLFSPWTFFLFPLMGVALLLALLLIKRRFGWRGQALSLVVLGFYQAIRERLWFGEFIPAVAFQPGVTTTLIMAAMVIAIGLIGLAVMRLVSGPDRRADRE